MVGNGRDAEDTVVDVDPVELVAELAPDDCVVPDGCVAAALDPLEAPQPVKIRPPAAVSTVIAIAGRREFLACSVMLLQPQIVAWLDSAGWHGLQPDRTGSGEDGQLAGVAADLAVGRFFQLGDLDCH